jgi:hypothetical protein
MVDVMQLLKPMGALRDAEIQRRIEAASVRTAA